MKCIAKIISLCALLLCFTMAGLAQEPAAPAKGNFLADKHMANGLDCEACHNNRPKTKPVKTAQCLTCHESYEKLAVRTKGMDHNPHAGHFIDLDCTQCHHGHKASENYCDSCHKK
ncbi:MAG: cytochrome c3 family protein [Acidobacteriota bacterium]|nr:cytochrome c3 family protein [Acidobacteriota bacterium]